MACESYRENFSFSTFKTIHCYTIFELCGKRQNAEFMCGSFNIVLRFLGRSFFKDHEVVNTCAGDGVVTACLSNSGGNCYHASIT